MEKTIKYLENGEYHYATVRSVGDLAQLKTTSKETLVEAINELWNGGGNVDPSKVPNPEGYDKLVQDVADAVKNQQETNQQWIEWKKEEAQLTEERKQAYLQAMKEMQEAIDKAKADAAALGDKTAKLDEQITKTFSELNTNIQNMHEQLQKEADRMNQELIDTKSDLTRVRTDLQNAQLDNGRIHDELTNINGKFEHKVWQTDLDPLKEQIDRAETSVQQTKDELLGKASRQDLDTVTNTVSKLDTQLKETAKGVEISVKKDELGGEIAEALTNKTNILLGTRRFTTNNWTQRDHVEICSDPWKGFLVAKQNSPIEGIQQAYDVKAGTTYTFSLYAKMDNLDDSNKPQIILAKDNLDTSLDTKIDVWRKDIEDITSDFKRYDLTFTPSEDCTIYPHVISNSNNPIFVCGYQLEIGKTSTPWEPNQEDVGDYVEKSEAQFNVYNDKIQALTEKQRQQGDTQEKLRTEVTQTAEGTRQVSENLKKTNDDITKLRGEFEVKADHMKSEYETYTNKAVGQISDSTLNLIRNSSFQNKDSDFDQWQNVSAKANVRSDENGLRWVELTQSGLTTDNPQGLTSNYFNVKQGKVTIAVDIKSGDKATLDNESVLFLELYNEAKKRVDFRFVTLSELGLGVSLLGDHKVHRGLYRLGIDRNDAKYMTVKAHLMRNGDLCFTNFSARLSSIDDGAYEPNPDDLNQQILKQNTKIEQNAKEVAIKANSVDVTRDIKSAVDGIQVGGTNVLKNTDPDSFSTTESDHTWTVESAGNGHGTIVDLDSNFSARHGFGIIGNAGGNKDFNQHPMHWNGGKYVFTVYVRLAPETGQTSVNALIRAWNYTKNTESYARMIAIKSREWQKLSLEIDSSSFYKDDCGFSFGVTGIGSLNFAEPMLVTGTKAMDWSPAPEDTLAEIKSAKDAAIQVASDQINIHVNELSTQFDDKLNKRINEQKTASEKFTSDGIEQVVTKVTNVKNDVDRLGDTVKSTGSRNLLHNTSDRYKTLTGNGYLAQSTASDIYTSTANYHSGDWFTYAATITNNSSKNVTLETWLFDQNKRGLDANSIAPIQLATHSADVYPGEKDKRVSTSFQISETTWFIRTYVISDDGRAPNGSQVQVKDERLVEGKLDGSWSPNPDDINRKIDTQTLDSANIDDLKTQGHYFVRNLTGNPIGGWVYVDVAGNNNDRIRQDVYQDNGSKHMYRRLFGDSWSDWEQGAYLSDVNSLKTEVTASVKNLGDRVTTEVNSITTRQDNFENEAKEQHSNDVELVRKSDFEDGSKGNWTVTDVVPATNPAPPAELGQSGMKVLQTNVRDAYEDGIWYSVKPGEKFDVDFWCAPSLVYASSLGLEFVDKDKKNPSWQGVSTKLRGPWEHITGTITAPANASFAKPWLNMDKPADNTENSSWIAKPHIRRQNPQVEKKISELNTKWDVANGQIQGKVTATDVNNILNGKGYATQSWAQTMFQMKSDSITLQAVRDNITNGIQNQLNDAKSQINSANGRIDETNEKIDKAKIGERNLAVGTNRGKTGWTISPGDGQSTMDDSWVNDAMGVVFNNSKKSTSWWVAQYPFDMSRLKPNTFYTISFDIQTDVKINGNGTVDFARGDSSGSPFVNSTSLKIITEPGVTTHVVCKAKTKGSIENNGQAFYFNSKDIGQANWVKIFNLMIVEGTQSIAWAAAPEDDDVKNKGINLLKSTAYWNPNDWNHISDNVWYDDNWTDNLGHKAYGHHTAWQGLGQTVYVTPGVYTWSAQIYLNGLDSNDYVYPYMGDSQYNGTVQVQEIRKPMLGVNDQNKWINYSATFYVKNAGNLCVRPELNRDHGTIHVGSQKLEHGMVATPWSPSPYDSDPKNIVSAINITPDQIKIASNKIEIDGNTKIHGVLDVKQVTLQGKSGYVDLSGDGINIAKNNGAGMNIGANAIQITSNTNGQAEVEGVITPAWSSNNVNQNGIGLILTTEQELGRPYGGDILTIGTMPKSGVIHSAMVFDATGITGTYKKGFNWFAPHTLNGDGGVFRFPNAQDDLVAYAGNVPGSRQEGYSQPTLALVHGKARGSAGLQFQWDDLVPFGRIETTHSYFAPVGANNDSGLGIGWVHWSNWDWDGNVPMIHRRDPNGGVNSGFAFFSSGDIVLWKGEYRSNLAWKIPASDPAEVPRIGGF